MDVAFEIDNEIISETKSSKSGGAYWSQGCLIGKCRPIVSQGNCKRGWNSCKSWSDECVINLYYAFIYPYIMYCNSIWGYAYKTSLSKLHTRISGNFYLPTTSSNLYQKQHKVSRCHYLEWHSYCCYQSWFLWRIFQNHEKGNLPGFITHTY